MRLGVFIVTVMLLASCSASSPTDADDRIAATRTAMEEFGDFDDDTPGCSLALTHRGDTHDVQVGLADVDAAIPITPDTVFDIGSVSKQMTGGVIAALTIDGTLALDDVVTDHLDTITVAQSVTIDDLVHHTSGLTDYIDLLDAELDEPTDMEDALDAIRSIEELEFEPGSRFDYSNTNYVLLAQIAESATGRDFVELSDDVLFAPLSMASTTVRDDQGELLPGQATGYERVGESSYRIVSSPWRQTGDGAVHSTPRDVLAWATPFIEPTETGTIAGSTPWVELMLTGGSVPDDDGSDYGFGLSTNGELVSHAGSWLGYSSYLGIRPDAAAAVALSCNVDDLDAELLGLQVLDLWS